MTRTKMLLLVAGAALAVSAASFGGAKAIGGAPNTVTREIPWEGADALIVGPPAVIRYVQATGPGRVKVTGPRRSVDRFTVEGGVLDDHAFRTSEPLTIEVTAPGVTRFSVKGVDKLSIDGFDQDKLEIAATGFAFIEARGRADLIKLHLQGFGWADLSGVRAKRAQVAVTGGRNAIVAPSESLRASGNGTVILTTRPAVTADFQGRGGVIEIEPLSPAGKL